MPLKIHRSDYEACAHRWSFTVDGMAGGAGGVTEACCTQLNGDFNLDFIPCWSNGRFLVWAGDCLPSFPNIATGCALYQFTVSGVTGFDCADSFNGSFLFPGQKEDVFNERDCVYRSQQKTGVLPNALDGTCDCSTNFLSGQASPWTFYAHAVQPHLFASGSLPSFGPSSTIFDQSAAYYSRVGGPMGTPPTVDFTLTGSNCGSGWPTLITATRVDPDGLGPDSGDRQRSEWMLEYDTVDERWSLHAFNRVKYPTYSLDDADPCDGNPKTLVRDDLPPGTAGCDGHPMTITITPECSAERRARERRMTGKTSKASPCGCDCQHEIDDARFACGQVRDDDTCEYPEGSDCCETCRDQDPPCAWIADFGCDISQDGISIAAAEVTLRHECYFDDECEWVAVGPSGNAQDGAVGKEPVCATCADDCQTCCTWATWVPGACPPTGVDLCDVVSPASKANCLEFRWDRVTTSGFTSGDVAAVLRFTSETISSAGALHWIFTSDDGEWVAHIFPNSQVPVDQFTYRCGHGYLLWNSPPDGFPDFPSWDSQASVGSPRTLYHIYDNGIYFDKPRFGGNQTSVRMYWITCP